MAKLSKIGSKKKKPSAKRYLGEQRWIKNKQKRQEKLQKRLAQGILRHQRLVPSA